MGRLLVHLHLYYQDQADFFLDRLPNITVPFKLIVTLTEENDEIRRKILSIVPDAEIMLFENCGYDVYPFFQAMKKFDLSSFDYILKLHTKNKRNKLSLNHLHYHGYGFRNNLVAPLIGSKECFDTAFGTISSSQRVGMVCPKFFLVREEAPKNRKYTEKLCRDYNIPYKEDVVFCAGTMFLCRSEIIRFLLKNDYPAKEYGYQPKTGSVGSLAHSMETMFGMACHHLGYEVKGVKSTSRYYSLVFRIKLISHKDIRWLSAY
jgi:lipopolysaccharide biosynthesis protein